MPDSPPPAPPPDTAEDWATRARALQEMLAALCRAGAGQAEDLAHRFNELAVLTRLAETQRQALEAAEAALARAEAARGVTAALAAGLIARGGPAPGWAALLREAPEFEPAWYLAQNPDLAAAGADPLAHYLAAGALELRDPGPGFDSLAYHLANPDVAAAGLPALVHWRLYGRHEGRPIR